MSKKNKDVLKKRYNIHKDFDYAKFVQALDNPISAELVNRLNARAIRRIDFGDDVIIDNRDIFSNDGHRVNLKIIRPAVSEGHLPCLINYNGGGFMITTSPMLMKNLVEYALRIHCVVVAVDYRVGVSHPFPKAFEDAYAGLKWVKDHGEAYGIDTSRLVVAGESAGGALAAGVCLKARDLKGPKILLQLLIYPALDYKSSQPSIKELYDAPVWPAKKNKKMWRRYLKNGYGTHIGYASPLWAQSLEGLPRTYIEVAEYDCLRDEGIAYNEALKEAGNESELHLLKGGVHGFDNFIDSAYVDVFVDGRIELIKTLFETHKK